MGCIKLHFLTDGDKIPKMMNKEVIVYLSLEQINALKVIAVRNRVTASAVLKKAIDTELYLEAQREKGSEVLIRDIHGNIHKLI